MFWLIRLGIYGLSAFTVWQFFQGSGVPEGFLAGRHLTLDVEHEMLLGVCAGVSNYTGLDVTVIRLLWVLGAFYRGIGVVLYILAFLLMPSSV
ncbi:MAG: pspC [Firmicutes bacterium]|nr:pspC [Bacillota bacterium]